MTDSSKEGIGVAKKTMDMVGGMVGKASAATMGSVSAGAFIENAHIGDLYEIEAAKLAIARSRNPELQRAAEEIIADHTTSIHQLRSALRMSETQVEPPHQLDTRRTTLIDHLRQASDDQFDDVWLDQQRLAHSETLTLFEGFASHGSDPQLCSYARSMVPALRQHRDMIDRLMAGA